MFRRRVNDGKAERKLRHRFGLADECPRRAAST
jgi:hypothetical protein